MNRRTINEPNKNMKAQTATTTATLPTQANTDIQDETPVTPTKPAATSARTFTDVIFLMSLVEAKAVLEVHPNVIPEGFTGARRAMAIQSGFNRAALKGHRVVAFNAMCNMVAEAVEAMEIPIQMRVPDRNALVALASRQGATDEDKAKAHHELVEAMKKQIQIPVRTYTCHEETTNLPEVEEF